MEGLLRTLCSVCVLTQVSSALALVLCICLVFGMVHLTVSVVVNACGDYFGLGIRALYQSQSKSLWLT